ncbi:12457_t:CDS:2, partial [Ambispora leptoticha]
QAFYKVYNLFIGLGIVYIVLSIYFSMVVAAYGRHKREEEESNAEQDQQPVYYEYRYYYT